MGEVKGFYGWVLRIKRADTPLTRRLKRAISLAMNPVLPPLPRLLLKIIRPIYDLHFLVIVLFRSLINILYRNPVFQSRCASFGKNVTVSGKLPFVTGPVKIHIGDNVELGGNLSIFSGNLGYVPRLILKDHASLGWNVTIAVNKEVIIEENARIPHDCRISDHDGHPKQADLRRMGLPPEDKEIRPVRICRDAWIGNGTHIMKGVTVGEGAIIGANSVVITDIPPFCLALGNPAEVYFKNYGKPSKKPVASQDHSAPSK